VFTEKHRVEFNAIAPYSFELTVHKPAGWWWSTPNEIFEDGVLWTTARLNSRLYGLRLEVEGSSRSPMVRCIVFSSKTMTDPEKDSVTDTVKRALGVEENLSEFYTLARKDSILRQTVENLCGMRTLDWPDLFPALTLAVTLQMAPMKRSNQMMDLIIRNFGERITFDGKTIAHWSAPEKIAELRK
jgi:DNA-3-methyladenine glycosylase II